VVFDGRNNEQRASPVSQLAGASFLGFSIISFSQGNMPIVASHGYHFADSLSLHRRHPVHCWNTANSTLSWVGQLLGPGVHPHDVGTDISCKQSVNEGQLVRILHV